MPRQDVGRTRVNASLTNQTTNQTVYTVTAGRTFFMTNYVLSAVNSSITTIGEVNIRDSGTTKIPHLMSKDLDKVSESSSLGFGLNLQEPVQFTTNVNVTVAGTVAYSLAIMGFEQ